MQEINDGSVTVIFSLTTMYASLLSFRSDFNIDVLNFIVWLVYIYYLDHQFDHELLSILVIKFGTLSGMLPNKYKSF